MIKHESSWLGWGNELISVDISLKLYDHFTSARELRHILPGLHVGGQRPVLGLGEAPDLHAVHFPSSSQAEHSRGHLGGQYPSPPASTPPSHVTHPFSPL